MERIKYQLYLFRHKLQQILSRELVINLLKQTGDKFQPFPNDFDDRK